MNTSFFTDMAMGLVFFASIFVLLCVVVSTPFSFRKMNQKSFRLFGKALFFCYLWSAALCAVYFLGNLLTGYLNHTPLNSNFLNFIEDSKNVYGLGLFIFLPLLQGYVLRRIYKVASEEKWFYFQFSALIVVLDLLFAFFIMSEGYMCLVMVMPLLWLMILLGIAIATWINQRKSKVLQISFVPLMLVLASYDLQKPNVYEPIMVSDSILIQAPPKYVWKYVLSHPENEQKPEYALWNIGLPMPVQSITTKAQIGAKRECRFTDHVQYVSKISEIVPNQKLTFDVIEQAQHPEIYGHVTFDRGQFILHDNKDGTTTLTNTGWYRLYIHPISYFDLWSSDITHHIHIRILSHIKRLAETDQNRYKPSF